MKYFKFFTLFGFHLLPSLMKPDFRFYLSVHAHTHTLTHTVSLFFSVIGQTVQTILNSKKK